MTGSDGRKGEKEMYAGTERDTKKGGRKQWRERETPLSVFRPLNLCPQVRLSHQTYLVLFSQQESN